MNGLRKYEKKLHIENCNRMIKHWIKELNNAIDYKERDQYELYINIIKSSLQRLKGRKNKKPKTTGESLIVKCKLLVHLLNKK